MPTLHWIGKNKVVNHHLEVPYRILQKQYTFGDAEKSENKIIHGDNLDALKSLLPEYEGKVKYIYRSTIVSFVKTLHLKQENLLNTKRK